jgi:hypothetical protein
LPATDTNLLKYYPDLTVFIGSLVEGQNIKRDSFTKWSADQYRMVDAVINVKYKVHKLIYGTEALPDTVEITSHDFLGDFEFLDYDYVMLYVYKDENKATYQHWYRHNKLFRTKDGRWAGPPPRDWIYGDSVERRKLNVRRMPYEDMARIKLFVYDDSIYYEDELEPLFKWDFPPSVYKMVGFEMVTDLGNYEIELFEYKAKSLIEKAIYDENPPARDSLLYNEPDVISVPYRQREKKGLLSKRETYRLIQFQEDFLDAIKTRDTLKLMQQFSPDIVVCDSVYTRSKFFEICFPSIADRIDSHYVYKYPVKKPWSVLKGSTGPYTYYQLNVELGTYFNQDEESKYRKGVVYQDKIYISHRIYDQNPALKRLTFLYVLRNGSYYLFGVDYFSMRDCCR